MRSNLQNSLKLQLPFFALMLIAICLIPIVICVVVVVLYNTLKTHKTTLGPSSLKTSRNNDIEEHQGITDPVQIPLEAHFTSFPSLFRKSNRLLREKLTITKMIQIYCLGHHQSLLNATLCTDCSDLLDFAFLRLDKCRFGNNKPNCGQCRVQCYRSRSVMRERIRDVMKYSGPRILLKHPLLALCHVIDSFRTNVSKKAKTK
ncbi:hypothetical protein GEMRC1_006639 [Eukaryota sp. GEM-RC1]